jgi:aquaporin Z
MPDPFRIDRGDADPVAAAASEAIGTFLLVFLAGAVLLQARAPDLGLGLLEVALAHGAAYALVTGVLPRAGGGCNPAVTVAFSALGWIAPLRALVLVAAQCGGALLAVVLLRALFPGTLWEAARGTRAVLSLDVSTTQGFVLEAIGAAALVLALVGAAETPRRGGTALRAGLTVVAVTLAIHPLTGASLNPARALAATLVTGAGDGLALHLTAPLAGALVMAMAWRILAPRPRDMGTTAAVASTTHEAAGPSPNDDAPPVPRGPDGA